MPKKIIVVDDERIICKMAKTVLELEGYEVDTFTDSVAALAAIRARQYDLIVTDLMMEKVSGMDILREVNQRSPQTKVIMLTAYATVGATIEAIKEQVYEFFAKPVKIEDLKRSVKSALGD